MAVTKAPLTASVNTDIKAKILALVEDRQFKNVSIAVETLLAKALEEVGKS